MFMHCGFSGSNKVLLKDGYHLLSELSPEKSYKFVSKGLNIFKGSITKYKISNPLTIHTTNNTDITCQKGLCIISHGELIPVSNSIHRQIDSIFDPKTGGTKVSSVRYGDTPCIGYGIVLDDTYDALENSLSVIIDGFIFITKKNTIEI